MIGLAGALVSSGGNCRFRCLHDVYVVFFSEVHL
jgi:hypothetical protein